MWSLFTTVNSLEARSPGSSATFLAATGISDKGKAALTAHVRAAVADMNDRATQRIADVCGKQDELKVSRSALLAYLDLDERESNERREAHTVKVGQVLDQEDAEKLHRWVDNKIRPNMKLIIVDRLGSMEAGNIDHIEVVNNMCSGGR